MRTMTRRAAIALTAGGLGLGVVAVAAPAVAGGNPFGHPVVAASQPGPGWRGGDCGGPAGGPAMGAGPGTMARNGSCLDPAPAGTLTDQQRAALVGQAEQEKLAHDLYAAFAARYDAVVFDRITAAETQHLNAVRILLGRYGLADPTAGKPAGQFANAAVQATYDRLLALGRVSRTAALRIGIQVEQTTISDLGAALNGLTAPDVTQTYTRLLKASQQHLTAFQRWS